MNHDVLGRKGAAVEAMYVMSSHLNPYEPPLPAPASPEDAKTVEPLGREGVRYAVMSLLISIAALAAHYLLCCWPLSIVAAVSALYVGINAYNRSTDDFSRVVGGVAIGLACLTGALAVWKFFSLFFGSI